MYDLLELLSARAQEIPQATKFSWNQELTAFYNESKERRQMFQFFFERGRCECHVAVSSSFEKPHGFSGNSHPELATPMGNLSSIILRLTPVSDALPKDSQKLYPMYVLEKKFFPNSEHVFYNTRTPK